MRWIEALKIWNAEKGGPWCVPRKGTPEHAIVKSIMAGKKPEPVKEECECKVEKKKKKIRIVQEEEAPTIVIKKKKKVRVAEEEPPVASAAAPAPAPAPAPPKKSKSSEERERYSFSEIKPKLIALIEEKIANAKRGVERGVDVAQNKLRIPYFEKRLKKLKEAKRLVSGSYWSDDISELRRRGDI